MNKLRKCGKLIMILLAFCLAACGTKKEDETNAVLNPWTDSNEQGVLEATGFDMQAPQGASDVQYSYMAESKMAQITYVKDNASWVYRMKATNELEELSGMNYEWSFIENGTVSGRNAIYLGYSSATEQTEYIDSTNTVQVVNWYDVVTGVSYSLSASGEDLNGMDIQVYAEELYVPLQTEVTDNPQKDMESELKDYFLGEHIRSFDESSIIIQEAQDGKYNVDISIIRLCSLDGGIGTFENHVMKFVVDDPNGKELQGRIYRDSDNSLTIEITQSTWEYLPNGEKLTGFDVAAVGPKTSSTLEVYDAIEYEVGYNKDSFAVIDDVEPGSVTFSYCKENVETAGSNVITFSVVKDAEAKKLIEEKVDTMGGKKSDIMDTSLTATSKSCYSYIAGGESKESELKVTQCLYAVPCGKDVILVEVFRTIGPDEAVEMSIDGDFEYIMQTFLVKK